jgi:hypothetical protein
MCTKFLSETPKSRDHVGRSKCIWEDNTEMYVNKIGCDDMGWIHLALVNIAAKV